LLKFREDIAHFIAEDPALNKDPLPIGYFEAKEKLNAMFATKPDYITLDKFKEIEPNTYTTILRFFTAFGICSYYPSIKKLDTVVLNPKWVTWGIYHIINWLKDAKKDYRLKVSDFHQIFKDNSERYPPNQYEFLYELMIHFELAYEDTAKHELVVPQCLKEDRASEIPVFPSGNRLYTIFEAKHEEDSMHMPFPSATMTRIIVKRSTEASFSLSRVWRYGAVLYLDNNTYALIEQTDSIIRLYVTGKNAVDYHSMLFGTVLEVTTHYKGYNENMLVIKHEIESGKMYPREELRNLAETGEGCYLDRGRKMTVDIDKTNITYNITNNITNVKKHVYAPNYGDKCNTQISQLDDDARVTTLQSISINDLEKLKDLIKGAQKSVTGTANVSDETKVEVSNILEELEEIRKELVNDPSKKSLLEKVWSKLKGIKEPISLGADFLKLLAFILPLIPKG